jgi:hypothetical protein
MSESLLDPALAGVRDAFPAVAAGAIPSPVDAANSRSLGIRSLGIRSLGIRSLGIRSLGIRSLGSRSVRRLLSGPARDRCGIDKSHARRADAI